MHKFVSEILQGKQCFPQHFYFSDINGCSQNMKMQLSHLTILLLCWPADRTDSADTIFLDEDALLDNAAKEILA